MEEKRLGINGLTGTQFVRNKNLREANSVRLWAAASLQKALERRPIQKKLPAVEKRVRRRRGQTITKLGGKTPPHS